MMKTLFLLLGNFYLSSLVHAQDPNLITNVKQYASLKAANNDTLNFLKLNYTSTYDMKPLLQFFADLEADGLAIRSFFLSDFPVGKINLVCFLEPVNRVKEMCQKGIPVYWIQIMLAYDLRPHTQFEECRIMYNKLVEFGINKIDPLSDELMELIKDIKVDFANIYHESIDYWKKEVGVTDTIVGPAKNYPVP